MGVLLMLTSGYIHFDDIQDVLPFDRDPKRRCTYKSCIDYINNETTIFIQYRGKNYFSCTFIGQLEPAAVRAYAVDMVQILLDKGVLK